MDVLRQSHAVERGDTLRPDIDLRRRLYGLARQPGLEPGIFGLILVFFILFEPLGIYGRWLKVKLYFSLFPLYKKATFKRQKTYTKSERNR